jgi:hypothetical protein
MLDCVSALRQNDVKTARRGALAALRSCLINRPDIVPVDLDGWFWILDVRERDRPDDAKTNATCSSIISGSSSSSGGGPSLAQADVKTCGESRDLTALLGWNLEAHSRAGQRFTIQVDADGGVNRVILWRKVCNQDIQRASCQLRPFARLDDDALPDIDCLYGPDLSLIGPRLRIRVGEAAPQTGALESAPLNVRAAATAVLRVRDEAFSGTAARYNSSVLRSVAGDEPRANPLTFNPRIQPQPRSQSLASPTQTPEQGGATHFNGQSNPDCEKTHCETGVRNERNGGTADGDGDEEGDAQDDDDDPDDDDDAGPDADDDNDGEDEEDADADGDDGAGVSDDANDDQDDGVEGLSDASGDQQARPAPAAAAVATPPTSRSQSAADAAACPDETVVVRVMPGDYSSSDDENTDLSANAEAQRSRNERARDDRARRRQLLWLPLPEFDACGKRAGLLARRAADHGPLLTAVALLPPAAIVHTEQSGMARLEVSCPTAELSKLVPCARGAQRPATTAGGEAISAAAASTQTAMPSSSLPSASASSGADSSSAAAAAGLHSHASADTAQTTSAARTCDAGPTPRPETAAASSCCTNASTIGTGHSFLHASPSAADASSTAPITSDGGGAASSSHTSGSATHGAVAGSSSHGEASATDAGVAASLSNVAATPTGAGGDGVGVEVKAVAGPAGGAFWRVHVMNCLAVRIAARDGIAGPDQAVRVEMWSRPERSDQQAEVVWSSERLPLPITVPGRPGAQWVDWSWNPIAIDLRSEFSALRRHVEYKGRVPEFQNLVSEIDRRICVIDETHNARRWAEAAALGRQVLETHGEDVLDGVEILDDDSGSSGGFLRYNIACALALLGQHEDAMTMLRAAIRKGGYRDWQHMERDDDLITLRDRPDYRALIDSPNQNHCSTSQVCA